jgi:outer membrane lipoprotein-sorting protein
MKKTFFYAIVLIFLPAFINAQNNAQAEKILTDLLNTAKTSAIKTNFKLVTNDKNNSQSASGIFTLKGTKFILDMNGMKVWFNGKTQWAFNEQNNEVSITEPTEKELSETNPMAILSGFKSKCTIRFATKIKSAQYDCIEMIPTVKAKDITKINVQIAKSNGNLQSISITNKNGNISTLTLTNFQKGVKAPDNIFIFNELKYKGITVNDLR